MGKNWSWTKEQKNGIRSKNSHNYGKHSWNYGLTKETDERVMKYSKSLKGEKHYNYGKHPSKKIREKMSESHKGENNPMYGVPSPNTGKVFSKEHRRKIGKGNMGKTRSLETKEKIRNSDYHRNLNAEKNPAWLDGKSFEPYTFDFNERFKKSIKKRDFYCCQMCNIGEEDLLLLKRYLVIHHIDYNKLLSIPQNCITLCNKCNGIANFNRKQWIVFFQSLLKERYNYKYTQDQKVILDYKEEIKFI